MRHHTTCLLLLMVLSLILIDFSPNNTLIPLREFTNDAFACGDCGEGCIAATPFVTLEKFTVTLSPDESKILIEWETSKEIRNLGFNILRAKYEDGESIQINDELISTEGGDTWGAAYIHEDTNINPNATYRYYLESKDECGAKYIFGPLRYGECEECEGNSCFIVTISNAP